MHILRDSLFPADFWCVTNARPGSNINANSMLQQLRACVKKGPLFHEAQREMHTLMPRYMAILMQAEHFAHSPL